MKRISTLFAAIFGIMAALSLTACEGEKELKVIDLPDEYVPYEKMYMLGAAVNAWDSNSPIEMEAVEGSDLFIKEVTIRYSTENKQFKFVASKGNWDAVDFFVPANADADGYVEIASPGTTYEVKKCSQLTGDLKDAFFGIPEGEDGVYKISFSPKDEKVTIELVRRIENESVNTENLYMLGMASGKWDSNGGLMMTALGDNKFSWEGEINYSADNKQFKFTTSLGAWDAVDYLVPEGADADGYVEVIGEGVHKLMKCSQKEGTLKDAFFGIEEEASGRYRVLVDTKAMTIELEKVGESSALYMLGAASGKWDSNDGLLMRSLGDNKFAWDGVINYSAENKQFKFATALGAWDAVDFLVPENADADGYVEVMETGVYKLKRCSQSEGTLKDAFFGIKEDESGHYRVIVDMNALTVELVNLQEPEELYMLGAASGQWDSNDGYAMEALGDSKFAWEGEINYSAENKQFKFATSKGSWDRVYYLIPEKADVDGYVEVVGEGEHKLQLCSRITEDLKDAFFGIAEGGDGIYRIEVDVKTLTLKITTK